MILTILCACLFSLCWFSRPYDYLVTVKFASQTPKETMPQHQDQSAFLEHETQLNKSDSHNSIHGGLMYSHISRRHTQAHSRPEWALRVLLYPAPPEQWDAHDDSPGSLLREIRLFDADLVCLEGLRPHHFPALAAALRLAGWDGAFAPEPRRARAGLASFWPAARFRRAAPPSTVDLAPLVVGDSAEGLALLVLLEHVPEPAGDVISNDHGAPPPADGLLLLATAVATAAPRGRALLAALRAGAGASASAAAVVVAGRFGSGCWLPGPDEPAAAHGAVPDAAALASAYRSVVGSEPPCSARPTASLGDLKGRDPGRIYFSSGQMRPLAVLLYPHPAGSDGSSGGGGGVGNQARSRPIAADLLFHAPLPAANSVGDTEDANAPRLRRRGRLLTNPLASRDGAAAVLAAAR